MVTAVILFSGGLDSTVALAEALDHGHTSSGVLPVFFCLGQKAAEREWAAAKSVFKHYKLKEHRYVDIKGLMLSSALVEEDKNVQAYANVSKMREGDPNAANYVPFRNGVFLSMCGAIAESVGAREIWTGFDGGRRDPKASTDAQPGFVSAMETALALGTRCGRQNDGISIVSPLMHNTKVDTILRGNELKAPLHLTWSCYNGGREPCGKCSVCLGRSEAFTAVLLSNSGRKK